MQTIAFKRFRAELKRLERLAGASEFAFSQVRESLKGDIFQRKVGYQDVILGVAMFSEPERYGQLIGRLKSQIPKYQRELIFVRIISSLEVYLIDVIREIAEIDSGFFKTDDTLSISRGELLRFRTPGELCRHLVEKDCRNLSSSGFREIAKYYKKHFDIEFADVDPDLAALYELHERRHLFVHRLGKTDEQYRHQYNTENKVVSVSGDDLCRIFDHVRKFTARHNDLLVRRLFDEKIVSICSEYRCICAFNGELHGKRYFDMRYTLPMAQVSLQTILKLHIPRGPLHIFILEGGRDTVSEYVQVLKSKADTGEIEMVYCNPRNPRVKG